MDKLVERIASRIADTRRRRAATRAAASPSPAGGFAIQLDYPTTARPVPRWGCSTATHPQLERLVRSTTDEQMSCLGAIAELEHSLRNIPTSETEDPTSPYWDNPMIAALDACLLGVFLCRRPRLYVEVGSGHSTRFVRYFIRTLNLPTRVVSIDPQPRVECDSLCDELERQPLETMDLSFFDRLGPDDLLFFDGSHRCFMNSDVTVFFLDVLPRLKAGVMIGIHDIFLPDDYPAEWEPRYYNEQYVLAAHLLGARDKLRVVFPTHFVSTRQRSSLEFARAERSAGCPSGLFHGCSFWFTHMASAGSAG
jgi:hypothetical protein